MATSPAGSTEPALLAIVGPTASGKSELALALAERLDGEILVADSRQVYRGMTIGTAKPGPADLARAPHHLLDLAAPDQRLTVADWLRAARKALREVGERGRLPIVVGGTGLYITALLGGYGLTGRPRPPGLRIALRRDLERHGLDAMAARLRVHDPRAVDSIDVRNPRRVLAALERRMAGDPLPTATAYGGPVLQLAIDRPRATLYRRIDERAAWLFSHGLVDEVRSLLAAGYRPELPAMSGHGYAETARYLAGEWTLDEAIEVTARRTRQYAKRQLSWFRRDPDVVWLPAPDAGDRSMTDRVLVDAATAAAQTIAAVPRPASTTMARR